MLNNKIATIINNSNSIIQQSVKEYYKIRLKTKYISHSKENTNIKNLTKVNCQRQFPTQ